MKFRGHETFYIRKGWLSKGVKAIENRPTLFVDKTTNPMDVLGIGSNMVKSLRYWLQATGLTKEVKNVRGQQITEFGNLVLEFDPYLEELGTLWLLHYHLVKGKDLSTAWYYFYNHFDMTEFEKEDFLTAIGNWLRLQGTDVSTRSLEEDFNCIVNTYVPRYKTSPGKLDPESNMECPLGELGLLDTSGGSKKLFHKTGPVGTTVEAMIALAIIMDNADGKKEILLSELLNQENNIGKVFNLDAISMLNLLDEVALTGCVRIVRTAGLDVLKIETDMTFIDCVKEFYDNLYEVRNINED